MRLVNRGPRSRAVRRVAGPLLALSLAVRWRPPHRTGPRSRSHRALESRARGRFRLVVICTNCSVGHSVRLARASRALGEGNVGRVTCAHCPTGSPSPTRGHPDALCTDSFAEPGRRDPGRRARDAYRRLLSDSPVLRRWAHVGLIGRVARDPRPLTSMVAPESTRISVRRRSARALPPAVALYPGCVASRRTWTHTGVVPPVARCWICDRRHGLRDAGGACRSDRAADTGRRPVDVRSNPGRVPCVRQLQPRALRCRPHQSQCAEWSRATTVATRGWADSSARLVAFFAVSAVARHRRARARSRVSRTYA